MEWRCVRCGQSVTAKDRKLIESIGWLACDQGWVCVVCVRRPSRAQPGSGEPNPVKRPESRS